MILMVTVFQIGMTSVLERKTEWCQMSYGVEYYYDEIEDWCGFSGSGSEPDSDGDGYYDYEDLCPGYGTNANWGCSSKTEWCQIEYDPDWYFVEDYSQRYDVEDYCTNDGDDDGYSDSNDNCSGYGTFENWGCGSKTEWCQIEYGRDYYSDGELCYPGSVVSNEPDADGDGTPDYDDSCPSQFGSYEYWGCTSMDAFCQGEYGSTYYYDKIEDYCVDSAASTSSSDFPEPSAEFQRLFSLGWEATENGNCSSALNYFNQASALREPLFDAIIKLLIGTTYSLCLEDPKIGLPYLEDGLTLAKYNNYPPETIERFEEAIDIVKEVISASSTSTTTQQTPPNITQKIIPKITQKIAPKITPKITPPTIQAPTPAPAPQAPAPQAPTPQAPTPKAPTAPPTRIMPQPVVPTPTTPTPTQPPITPVTLSIDTDRTTYNQGNLVTINTEIDGITSNANIAISVIDPSGNIVITRTLFIDDTGSIPFKISHGTTSGSYKVTASVNVNGQNYEDTSQFTVKKDLAGLTIKSVAATNQQGNLVDSFSKGNQGYIKLVLSSDSTMSNSLITVTLLDSDLIALGTSSIKTLISSADSEIILSFYIPNDATTGIANVYVNAFTDWPSNGGIPLTREGSTEIGIEETTT